MAGLKTESLVPMRWPCGPLGIEQAREREGFSPEDRAALERCAEPEALEVLADGPVDCLVVPWAAGGALDADHQRRLGPLLGAARRQGLTVVGEVGTEADLRPAAAAAETLGLAALATESEQQVGGLPVLRFHGRDSGRHEPGPFLGVADCPWPGLNLGSLWGGPGVDAVTRPTGPPWIDSNAWYVRLARTLMGAQTIWLSFDPPEGRRWPLEPGDYVRAVADAAVFGARWMVSLDSGLRRGLLAGEAPARESWARIRTSLAFFEQRLAWREYRPAGQIGVLSDFAGGNEFLSFEVVNLLARQSSMYRLLDKARAVDAPLDELQAVLYVDEEPPEGPLLRKLYAFAEAGGTLITPPGWEERGSVDPEALFPRFRVFRLGQGRLAVARGELADPHQLAEDAQLLTSHRHDLVRLFNSYVFQLHFVTRGDGPGAVLHLFRYGPSFFDGPATVWFRDPWTSAREWRAGGDEGGSLQRLPADSGVEFHLPTSSPYSAIEVTAERGTG